jgi:4-alpha-glucanotransferase
MTEPELIRAAQAAGIATRYEDWQHRDVAVPAATLEAILAALDAAGDAAGPAAGQVAGPAPDPGLRAPRPAGRTWGLTVQLYSVRSRRSWGHGDLGDLSDLVTWSGRDLGAGFILVNPLLAAEPAPPVSPSPYLPMSRRYTSPLYLRVEDIPEYGRLAPAARARIDAAAAPLRARDTSAELIDRDAVWGAKRAALELIRAVPLDAERQAGLGRYVAREGAELDYWAAWCALAERHGPDWRAWPAGLHDRAAGLAAVAADPELGAAAAFHAWLQWLADEQLGAAQEAARAAGMAIGIIHDLPVGVHPGGCDAWAHQDLLVAGVCVGAPPDSFNQRGQNWAQPPWNPRQLARAGYRPLAGLLRSAGRHAGGLRVDHVMGLARLWWVPDGMPADQGAYVHYDHRASVAALAGAAAAAGAVAIGEDLGTVEPWLTRYLADHDILGTTMAWFATEPDGSPLRPEHWRAGCMATVGTHDVPTIAGFLTGASVTDRARLGLLTQPEDQERAQADELVAGWRAALTAAGLLPAGAAAGPDEVTVALYGYLALTPALLVGVSLADTVGEVRSQNVPGTSDEYPNWRIPLCDGAGRAVLLDDLPARPLVAAVAKAVRILPNGGAENSTT